MVNDVDRMEEERVRKMLAKIEVANGLPHTDLVISTDAEPGMKYIEGKGYQFQIGTKSSKEMKDDELSFVIGHELAHAKCHHAKILELVNNNASKIEDSCMSFESDAPSMGTAAVCRAVALFHEHEADVIGCSFAVKAGYNAQKSLEEMMRRMPSDELYTDTLEGTYFDEHPAMPDRVSLLKGVDVSKVNFDAKKRDQYLKFLQQKSKTLEGAMQVEDMMVDRVANFTKRLASTIEKRLDNMPNEMLEAQKPYMEVFKDMVQIQHETNVYKNVYPHISPKKKALNDVFQKISEKSYDHMMNALTVEKKLERADFSFPDISVTKMDFAEPVRDWKSKIDTKEDALGLMRHVGQECIRQGQQRMDTEQVHAGKAFVEYAAKLQPAMYLKDDVLEFSDFIVSKTNGKVGSMESHVEEYKSFKNVTLQDDDVRSDKRQFER